MYDVAIIGAGVVGGMTARELARYDLRILIVDKENDVACGATKANSAIVHAGFDAESGTLKAKLNVQGSKMMEETCRKLGVKYKKNGSLVIGFCDSDREVLEKLLERGNKNGVEGLRILDRDGVRKIEPNIADEVTCALYAPSGAIVCPYDLTVSAVGNAMDNGAEFLREFKVTKIDKKGDSYVVCAEDGRSFETRYIVNAAGLYSDEVASLAGDNSFKIKPRRGEYILLDRECGNLVSHTIFRTPSAAGKGILVSPTVDGNLLTGPTSVNIEDKEDKSTTAEGFAKIIKEALGNIKGIPYGKTITSFCGLRAAGDTGDFIIKAHEGSFINVAGIESPGLSASPAIALMVRDMLCDAGLELREKSDYNPERRSAHFFSELSLEEKNEIIKKDKTFGRIICRCESVTEGEILDAIRRNPKPFDLDGVKRRTRAQMGRCQGGFCTPYIMELLAREHGVPYESITKKGKGSHLITGKTKEGR